MDLRGKKTEFADTSEVQERDREVRYIFNVVQPDPEYQPIFLSDESTLLDATSHDEAECRRRLECYFGSPFPCSLHQPVWRLVDEIKRIFPGWPDEFTALHDISKRNCAFHPDARETANFDQPWPLRAYALAPRPRRWKHPL